MRYDHVLLRCGLVGLAAIFSGAVGAADLTCTSTSEGYRCEAWPQGSEYRYHWHIAQDASRAAVAIDEPSMAKSSCANRIMMIGRHAFQMPTPDTSVVGLDGSQRHRDVPE